MALIAVTLAAREGTESIMFSTMELTKQWQTRAAILLARADADPAPSGAIGDGSGLDLTPPPLTPEQYAALPHDNAAVRLNTTIWTLLAVATLFLSLRLYCKYRWHRGLWWDDWVLLASWVCITIESCILTQATTLGYGSHTWDIPPNLDDIAKVLLLLNVAGTFSVTAAIWSKTSFAITLLRLTKGWTKAVVWFIIVSMNIAMGLSALFVWVQCTPVEKAWKPFMVGAKCWAPTVLVYYNVFSASYSATMDIALALLPWKLIWGLQMKQAEKLGVAVAMSCGLFAGITAIVKTTKIIPGMLSLDTYDGADLYIWGNAESCVTIIATSIPILRVFVREVQTSARKYYVNTDAEGSAGFRDDSKSKRSRLQSHNTAVVSAQHSRFARRKGDDDFSDDKSMLDGQDKHIVQTSEIAVEYEMQRMPPK